MHAKPDLRVFLKWLIARSGSVITDVIQLQPADQKSRDGKTQSIPKPDGGIRTCADSDPLFDLDCNRAFCLVFEFHGCGTHIR